MKAYIQLTLAQLRIFSRNRSVIVFTLLFPIILMTALGSFAGGGMNAAMTAAVVDLDHSEASGQFTGSLRDLHAFTLTSFDDEQQAVDSIKKSDNQFVVVIPHGYGEAVKSGAAKAAVYYDETNMGVSQIGLPLINQAADNVSKELAGYKQRVTLDPKGIQSVKLKYIDFLVPGIVSMMIMSNNLNGVAGQIAAWRERGILRRMQSTTLRASTFISAQITARLILNGLQAMLVLLIGSLFFGTQVNGSWFLLIGFVVLGTLTFMSIGFIIAGLARTPESAGPIAGFISFPMLFLGGVFFPVKSMPDLLQPLVKLLPITHLSTALRQIMNVGAGLGTLWPEAALLGGWLVVAFIAASFSFKWE